MQSFETCVMSLKISTEFEVRSGWGSSANLKIILTLKPYIIVDFLLYSNLKEP